MNWLKYLVGLSAIIIAAAAAYFSVSGLSKLFAGATIAIIIMASSLEFAKLVAATYLKQKWNVIKGFNKFYLSTAVAILMLITSAGIYGFLTSAYQATADELIVIEQQISVAQLKKGRFQEQLNGYTTERNNLSNSISDLSKGLSSNVIRYTDKDGKEVVTTSAATRRTLEKQLNDMKTQRDNVSTRIDVLNDSITSIDTRILNIQSGSKVAAEVGPLKYMSKLTGKSMDVIVNWFALSIVLVFDPLAIALIIAFNGLVLEEKSPTKNKGEPSETPVYEVYGDKKQSEPTFSFDDSSIKTEPLPSQKIVSPGVPLIERSEYQPTLPSQPIKRESSENFDELEELEVPKEPILYQEEPKVEEQPAPAREPLHIEPGGDLAGYDTNGDGLIDEYFAKNSVRAREIQGKQPYYTQPTFNWDDKSTWINDQAAVNYWLRFKRPHQENTDDDVKKY